MGGDLFSEEVNKHSFIHYSALTLLKSELVFIKVHASYKEELIYSAHANASVIHILHY